MIEGIIQEVLTYAVWSFLTSKVVLFVVGFSLLFWLLFVNFMTLRDKREETRGFLYYVYTVLYYMTGLVGVPVDVVYNAIIGPLLFLEWRFPGNGEWMFTGRIRRHVFHSIGWRHRLALWICRRLVEPWDPDHCNLSHYNK